MEWLPAPRPGSWTLVIAPHAGASLILDLTARLACRGPVCVLDGGDRFQAHLVARAIRRYLPPGSGGGDMVTALERTRLARAFTCYQMVTLLGEYQTSDPPGTPADPSGPGLPTRPGLAVPDEDQPAWAPLTAPAAEGGPARLSPPPALVLDLLATFYDESVSRIESQRLLELCIAYLNRMAARAPLAVSVRPPHPASDRFVLVERLEAETAQVFRLEPPGPYVPLRLF